MNLPKQVEIVEVSPRDGLQMLPLFVPTADKINLINLAKDAGFKRIEAVSFVSPKAVPQSDTLPSNPPGTPLPHCRPGPLPGQPGPAALPFPGIP